MAGTRDNTRQRARGRVAGAAPRARELRTDQLLAAVESELIPRLLVTHAADVPAGTATEAGPRARPEAGPWAAPVEVRRFATLCLEDSEDGLNRHVSALLSRDVALDAVYLHLVAPAARHLGDLWSDDELSFVDVQLGLSRLHRLVRECNTIGARRIPAEAVVAERSIAFTTVPGDQHTFGVTLAADFFDRHGWEVANLAGLDRRALLEDLSGARYAAVGLSLHNDEFAARLPELVRELRASSANPDILVLLGGDYFVRHPERGLGIGADLVACDAYEAIRDAERLLERVAGGLR